MSAIISEILGTGFWGTSNNKLSKRPLSSRITRSRKIFQNNSPSRKNHGPDLIDFWGARPGAEIKAREVPESDDREKAMPWRFNCNVVRGMLSRF